MRGPSSSHTAASWRIGKVACCFLGEPLKKAVVEFDSEGGWAPNYEEQGTVLGMTGGLLDIDITDRDIVDGTQIAVNRGVHIEYKVSRFPTDHPNTVRVTLEGVEGARIVLVAVSLGGGMFETRMLQGHVLQTQGDYFDMVGFLSNAPSLEEKAAVESIVPTGCRIYWSGGSSSSQFHIQSAFDYTPDFVDRVESMSPVSKVVVSPPIMPIISGREQPFDFTTYGELVAFNASRSLSASSLGLLYESQRSGLSESALLEKMGVLVDIVEESIAIGLKGTHYEDRILHQQSHLIAKAEKERPLPGDALTFRIIENISAVMEAKSGMEVIVAAPTAGGCGTLPGVIKAVCDAKNIPQETKVKAYFAAGLVGVFFANGPGFSAETGGCQLETGAAAAMAAAALADMFGGSSQQSLGAASMALQNTIGLVCDPVADRVEVPCLGKNITAGMNALAASTMALSGYAHVIPLDEVIETVKNVAASMPRSLCCTGLGGLAATPTSAELKKKLSSCVTCS